MAQAPQDPATKEILNAQEAANLLGLNAYTLRRKARAGELPGRKVGREWRFLRRSLLDWLGHTQFIRQYEINELTTRIREVAGRTGYAIAVHGSMLRDLDLIAVPWTNESTTREDLLTNIQDHVGLYTALNRSGSEYVAKPHGRRGYLLYGAACLRGRSVDLSIMPRVL